LGSLWIGKRNASTALIIFPEVTAVLSIGRTLSSPENSVNAITEDYTGRLWIGTDNGYLIYIPDKELLRR
jgi:ligand-binding sensor domain-containing protein